MAHSRSRRPISATAPPSVSYPPHPSPFADAYHDNEARLRAAMAEVMVRLILRESAQPPRTKRREPRPLADQRGSAPVGE